MKTDYAWWAQSLSADARREVQMKRFQGYLEEILRTNEFYKEKYADVGLTSAADFSRSEAFGELPFTVKQELSEDQEAHPPYGRNLTYPRAAYTRVHQTSGTSGKPLRWLDDEGSWLWWIRCWEAVYRAAGVSADDRIFFAFSFGPFIGFWSAYDGAQSLRALAIPGGGMSSYQRLVALLDHEVTVLICTPTYALHLAEVAESEGIDLRANSVRTTIHAGEPGGSIPATKRRIESLWGVGCFDHAGATEVGAWGFE
jgi:phenylacetate-CoA ligase